MLDRVDAEVLRASLLGPGRLWTSIEVVDATGSTNADLAAAARRGEASGTVLISMFQATGRGRFARRWEAPPGSSIAISVLLRPAGEPRWPWLPLVTGLAVGSGLRVAAGVDTEVKWPNDVLIGGRKVCGILAERVDDAAVVGIGINTLLTEDQLPVPTATSLRLAGSEASSTTVALAVLAELERAASRWLDGTDLQGWYSATCATIGRQVRVLTSRTEAVTGEAVGVDADGRLLVRIAGEVRAFAAGDVHHLRGSA